MRAMKWILFAALIVLILAPTVVRADVDDDSDDYDGVDSVGTVENNLKGAKIPSVTDDDVVRREEHRMSSEGYSVAEQKLMKEQAQKFTFQAEVNKLMNILINSLYSNKEIFLRELISNASDALDKIRFLALTNPALLGEGEQAILDIKIKVDIENKVLTITDHGVGMTKDDLIKNLGTIAQSGTKDFLNKFAEDSKATSSLIGQFGVGFYSAFLVADTVTVTSKHNDDDQYIWTSQADGSFAIVKDPQGNTLGRGTKITLYLKEDATEYMEIEAIKTVAKKYSEFINFPIYLWTSKTVTKEPEVEEVSTEEKEPQVEDEQEETTTPKNVTETIWNWELLNDSKPIWTRAPKDVTEEEYQKFFKLVDKKGGEALKWTHFTAEGEAEFKSILYVPKEAPANMFDPSSSSKGSLKLFVRRVFITDDFEGLIPNYLRFIRGIVDSDDLPLNVSREILQQNKLLKLIEKRVVRKSIAMFQEMAQDKDNEDTWRTFYEQYATNIKLGVIEDSVNRSRLAKLLMFSSSKTGENTFLEDYVSRMKEGQDQIYYLAGTSKDLVEKSPLLESVIKKGYEVLYMVDPIDEYMLQSFTKYDKYTLTNLAKDGVKLSDDEAEDEKEKKAANEESFKILTDFIQNQYKDQLEKVVVSDRLATKTPCTLVASAYGYSANMERIIKAQALGQGRKDPIVNKKIMEINPNHPIIKNLLSKAQDNSNSKELRLGTAVLFETSLITSGYSIEDPTKFADTVHNLMSLNLGVEETKETIEETKETVEETINSEEEESAKHDEL